MITVKTNKITVAHVVSESGDHYLPVFEGELDWSQTKEAMIKALDFEEPDCLYLEQIEVVEFNGE
jgi:hypothetical protein